MSKSGEAQVATLIAAPGETFASAEVSPALAAAGATPIELRWLERNVALDALFERAPADLAEAIEAALAPRRIDVIVQPAAHRRKALLIADMDATMIEEESLDELARGLGLGEKVARLTEAAMRGDIPFEAALATRVALFEGVAVEAIERLAKRLTPSCGGATLVATMRAHGAFTVLASGGFTLFAAPIGAGLGFDAIFANRLEIESGRLTGRITPPIRGAGAKGETLAALRQARGLAVEATLAVGDGANDLEMLAGAGLGVAYRAKPRVAARAAERLNHADLTALLYAQGFSRAEFVEGGRSG